MLSSPTDGEESVPASQDLQFDSHPKASGGSIWFSSISVDGARETSSTGYGIGELADAQVNFVPTFK